MEDQIAALQFLTDVHQPLVSRSFGNSSQVVLARPTEEVRPASQIQSASCKTLHLDVASFSIFFRTRQCSRSMQELQQQATSGLLSLSHRSQTAGWGAASEAASFGGRSRSPFAARGIGFAEADFAKVKASCEAEQSRMAHRRAVRLTWRHGNCMVQS